jgi:glycosyltransferase involved in cell wall biosynthesis
MRANLDLMHFTIFSMPIAYYRPFVVTIHDLTPMRYPGKKMHAIYRRYSYRLVLTHATTWSKQIITVSRSVAQDLVDTCGVREQKITTTYLGVDKTYFEPTVQDSDEKILIEYAIKTGEYILSVGIHRDHKNHIRLIEAFALVHGKHHHMKLVIVGKENATYGIRAAAHRL